MEETRTSNRETPLPQVGEVWEWTRCPVHRQGPRILIVSARGYVGRMDDKKKAEVASCCLKPVKEGS